MVRPFRQELLAEAEAAAVGGGGGGGGGVLSSLSYAEVPAAQVYGQGVVKFLHGDVHQRVRVPVVRNACGG